MKNILLNLLKILLIIALFASALGCFIGAIYLFIYICNNKIMENQLYNWLIFLLPIIGIGIIFLLGFIIKIININFEWNINWHWNKKNKIKYSNNYKKFNVNNGQEEDYIKEIKEKEYYKKKTEYLEKKLLEDINNIKENIENNAINKEQNAINHFQNEDKENTEKVINDFISKGTKVKKYNNKSLITNNEKYFYDIIEEYFGSKYKIQTQVNLASIIEKTTNERYRNELFRNIDIGIFTKELEPLLLIEIDDATHNQAKRKYRDVKVKQICEEAGIKLIKFYTRYSNKKDYIINRIKEELN